MIIEGVRHVIEGLWKLLLRKKIIVLFRCPIYLYHSVGKFSRWQILKIFSYFPQTWIFQAKRQFAGNVKDYFLRDIFWNVIYFMGKIRKKSQDVCGNFYPVCLALKGHPEALTLAMLNKLKCHTHFLISVNQITWSGLLIQIHILIAKQGRSRSLIWIYTVCKDRVGHIWVQQDQGKCHSYLLLYPVNYCEANVKHQLILIIP